MKSDRRLKRVVLGLRYGKRYAACISTWHTGSFWYGDGTCIYCGKKREKKQ